MGGGSSWPLLLLPWVPSSGLLRPGLTLSLSVGCFYLTRETGTQSSLSLSHHCFEQAGCHLEWEVPKTDLGHRGLGAGTPGREQGFESVLTAPGQVSSHSTPGLDRQPGGGVGLHVPSPAPAPLPGCLSSATSTGPGTEPGIWLCPLRFLSASALRNPVLRSRDLASPWGGLWLETPVAPLNSLGLRDSNSQTLNSPQ